MTPMLIGITGYLGVGKSTVAEMLAELIPQSQVVAFADALKTDVHRMIRKEIGTIIPDQWIADHKTDIFGNLYQGYGELCRQYFGPDYWVDRLASNLPERAIVADVRYLSEAAWLHVQGGLLVSVVGPTRREGDTRSRTHPPEAGVPNCRSRAVLEIRNLEGLDDLRRQVVEVARVALASTEPEVP